jgi:hypothetical protein
MEYEPGRQSGLPGPRVGLPPLVAFLPGAEPDQLGQLLLPANQPLGGDVTDLGGVACQQQLTRCGRHHVDQVSTAGG